MFEKKPQLFAAVFLYLKGNNMKKTILAIALLSLTQFSYACHCRDSKLEFSVGKDSLVVTAVDFNEVSIDQDHNPPTVLIDLKEPAASKFTALAKRHLYKPLQIKMDGKLISAPVIQGELSNRTMLTGLTAEQAEKLVKDFKGEN